MPHAFIVFIVNFMFTYPDLLLRFLLQILCFYYLADSITEGATYNPTDLSELKAGQNDDSMGMDLALGKLCSVSHQHTYVQHIFISL